jgi:hypothetical protein
LIHEPWPGGANEARGRSTDDSWLAQAPPAAARGAARAVSAARGAFSYAAFVLVAVPLLLLKCSLLVHCVRQCKRVEAI